MPPLGQSAATQLESDSALAVMLSVTAPRTYSQLWTRLSKETGRLIRGDPDDKELNNASISLACQGVSALALMDAMAARFNNRWDYQPAEGGQSAGYMFVRPQHEEEMAFTPYTPERTAVLHAGTQFFEELGRLPKEAQDRLLSNTPHHVKLLPQPLQQPLADMLTARNAERAATAKQAVIRPDQLPIAQIKLQVDKARGFDRRFVMLHVNGVGTSGWSWTNYEQKRDAREAERIAAAKRGELWPQFDPRHSQITNAVALLLPDLKKIVSVKMVDATFPDVLAALHRNYGVSYVSDTGESMPQLADVNLASIPLGEALDRLTKTYRDSSWEWRKLGFLVVRGPKNLARMFAAAKPPSKQYVTSRVSRKEARCPEWRSE